MCGDEKMQAARVIDSHLNASVRDTLEEGVPDRFSKLVDDNLKKAFGDTVEEDIPDRFKSLLEQLKAVSEKDEE